MQPCNWDGTLDFVSAVFQLHCLHNKNTKIPELQKFLSPLFQFFHAPAQKHTPANNTPGQQEEEEEKKPTDQTEVSSK